MKHSEFVKLAQGTARNAQGLRKLAPHVRLLYDAIRTLQDDDNAYLYMAEVLLLARGDKLDAQMIADRIRAYHFRDRAARGDAPVERGARKLTRIKLRQPQGSLNQATTINIKQSETELPPLTREAVVPTTQSTAQLSSPNAPVNSLVAYPADHDRGAITRQLHQKQGRRKVVQGGG
jgi:hypothetical protein